MIISNPLLAQVVLDTTLLSPAKNNLPIEEVYKDTNYEYEIIYEYDTVYQYDTIIDYDTLYVPDDEKVLREANKAKSEKGIVEMEQNAKEKTEANPFNRKKYWSLGFNIAPIWHQDYYRDAENKSHIHLRENFEDEQISFNAGIEMAYHSGKFDIGLGLSYLELRCKSKYPYSTENIDTSFSWDITSESFWQNDTIDEYYQIVNNDTVWYYVIKEVWITEYDSTEVTAYDTISEIKTLRSKQIYKHLDVPIIASYCLYKGGDFEIDAQLGVITSFFIKRTGQVINYRESQSHIIPLSKYPYVKSFFSGLIGVSMKYCIGNQWIAEISPIYRKTITSLVKDDGPLSHNFDYQAIRFSLKYIF